MSGVDAARHGATAADLKRLDERVLEHRDAIEQLHKEIRDYDAQAKIADVHRQKRDYDVDGQVAEIRVQRRTFDEA